MSPGLGGRGGNAGVCNGHKSCPVTAATAPRAVQGIFQRGILFSYHLASVFNHFLSWESSEDILKTEFLQLKVEGTDGKQALARHEDAESSPGEICNVE